MSRIALVLLILGLCLTFWLISSRPALIRGVADGMLVSPHRPDVAVRPAQDFNLLEARRTNLAVTVEHQSVTSSADAWYALYATANGHMPPARLIALFAQARQRYEWHYDDPRPTGAAILKQKLSRHGEAEGSIMLYTMMPSQDPWQDNFDNAPWPEESLVCRWRFHMPLWRFVVMVEYREPLPAGSLPPDADPAALAAFELRAYKSFALISADKEHALPAPSQNLPYPSKEFSRTRLSAALGPVRSTTQN